MLELAVLLINCAIMSFICVRNALTGSKASHTSPDFFILVLMATPSPEWVDDGAGVDALEQRIGGKTDMTTMTAPPSCPACSFRVWFLYNACHHLPQHTPTASPNRTQ